MQSYRFLSIIMVYELRKRIPELLYLQVGGAVRLGWGILAAIRSLQILRADNFTFWCKKSASKICRNEKKAYLCIAFETKERALNSAGSEHLPYKQRVGGSNPSAPTTQEDTRKVSFLFYVINLCFFDNFSLF